MKTLETIKNEIEAKATEAVIHEDRRKKASKRPRRTRSTS